MAFSSPFLHLPLTSHPTVVCLRLQILPWWVTFILGAHDLCVTKSTGDLHSKVMDTWNTPLPPDSLAAPLLTAFWIFFPTHTSTFFPRTLPMQFYFIFCFFLIFYCLWKILLYLCSSYYLYANINKSFFFPLSLTSSWTLYILSYS